MVRVWTIRGIASLLILGLTALGWQSVAGAHRAGHACTASNHCTSNGPDIYGTLGDGYTNYDSKILSIVDQNQITIFHNNYVDWQVTMLFHNNAAINKVKNALINNNPTASIFAGGGTQYMPVREGGEYVNGTSVPPLDDMQWHVDADSGIKPRSTDRALGTWVVAVSAGLGVAERAFVAVGAR
jgi:hypothetical protein